MEKNSILDNIASLMNDATSTAKGLGKEAQGVFGSQIEKVVSKLDLVKQSDFEVLKTMVSNLVVDNEDLKKRVAELESKKS